MQPILAQNRAWLEDQSGLLRVVWDWELHERSRSLFATLPGLESLVKGVEGEKFGSPVAEFLQAARHWLEEQERREQQRMRDLSSVGWGVIFPEDIDPAIRVALQPLLAHRQAQATRRNPDFYREFTLKNGRQAHEFLADQGAGEGLPEPEKVPHYLLIVASPEEIPFTFQYQLDVNYAVGRLHFDYPVDYANYAGSVVAAEANDLRLERKGVLFGVGIRNDRVSEMATQQLIEPLYEAIQKGKPNWEINIYTEERTTKEHLSKLLGGPDTPAYLFTASHGIILPVENPRQVDDQGALLCYDYPGKGISGSAGLPPEFYFASRDVPEEASLLGLVAFLWTGFGAGTPRLDNFYRQKFKDEPAPLTERAFVARLPQRLLSYPHGGALAVISHVDNLYSTSFMGLTGRSKPQTFANMLTRLLEGYPVGAAMEFFNQRYQELATLWANVLMQRTESGAGSKMDRDYAFANIETAMVDARNYIILGDPAVHLMVAEEGQEPAARPRLEPVRSAQNLFFHPAPVSTVAWSPDGTRLLTVCEPEASLWSVGGGLIWSFKAPKILATTEEPGVPCHLVRGVWGPGRSAYCCSMQEWDCVCSFGRRWLRGTNLRSRSG